MKGALNFIMFNISDLAKDCIDCMRQTKESIDRMVCERYRLATSAFEPNPDIDPAPSLFRYAAINGGAHHCVFCESPTVVTCETLSVLPIYPSHFVAMCSACKQCLK